ncbi:MAG TPA: hypothetical protein VN778_03565, partial [Verrucomicrobiae bacterium]|nr:hypothetical protein [Verrucomicrobiae bacterium]
LLPLAGAAGVHVAKTLTSKPSIPLAPQAFDDGEEMVAETDEPEEITTETAGDQPVGTLAGLGAAAAADDVETVELDDDETPEDVAATPKSKDFAPPTKKNKKLKVPNFERFRLLLVVGALVLLLLIAGLIFALTALPKATINVKTDATNVPVNLNVNLATDTSSADPTSNTIPAKLESQVKTYTQQVPTTGQKNEGNKASGTVTITNCGPSDETIPAGTGFSANGNTYISQDDVSVPQSSYSFGGQKCHNDGKATVNATAQSGGSSYNLPSGASMSIASQPAYTTATSGSISGGTDNVVQVVNQNDIATAKSKISTNNDTTQKQALANQLQQEGYYAITSTFSSGTPNITSSPDVGAAANSVTVTETVTYTMFGAHENDLKTLIDNAVKAQIDTSKQSILSEGLDTATFGVNNSSSSSAQLTMQATAEAGPQIDVNTLKEQAAGKKPGDVKSTIGNDPDVTGVEVKLSPFWVNSVPKKTSRITVNIAKPTTTTKSNATNP